MEQLKASEVSALLRQQIESFERNSELEEVGTVLQVGDGIARVYGLQNVQSNELVELDRCMGVVLNLEQDNVGIVLFGPSHLVSEGDTVRRTGKIASLGVGEGMLGRVVDALGEPLDGKGPISGARYEMPLERKAPEVIFRQPVKEPLQTGLKAVDAMIPIGRGQRELIIGDRQTGKTACHRYHSEPAFFLRKGRARILHLRSHWSERQYCGPAGKNPGATWRHGLHHCGDGHRLRSRCHAVLCALYRNGHWGIFSGYRSPRPHHLRRFVQAGGLLP